MALHSLGVKRVLYFFVVIPSGASYFLDGGFSVLVLGALTPLARLQLQSNDCCHMNEKKTRILECSVNRINVALWSDVFTRIQERMHYMPGALVLHLSNLKHIRAGRFSTFFCCLTCE